MSARILLIDDDSSLGASIQVVLESRGYEVVNMDNGREALDYAAANEIDLVLTDYRMPKVGGMQVLERMQEINPRVPVIMMTAYSTTDRAIEATKKGAFDYLVKPFEMPELLGLIANAISSRELKAKAVSIGREDAARDSVVGSSRQMQLVFKEIGKIAEKSIGVLIKGETGTGKELVARAIFQHSLRADKPFVAVNCAAIPENLIESELFGHEKGSFTGAVNRRIGRFEQAHGGTLFLDEVGDLPWQTQVKLLRVLQEKSITRVGGKEEIPIDVRIISATHCALEEMIAKDEFREDLYYRLNASVIELPSLRERREDIPELVYYFLRKYALEFNVELPAVHKDALSVLTMQNWPGNVRQLENVIRRSLIDCRGFTISKSLVEDSLAVSPKVSLVGNSADLQSASGGWSQHIGVRLAAASMGELSQGAFEVLVEDLERELYAQAVALSHGNQTSISKWLGVSRITVREKLDKYQLFPKRKGPED